MSMCNCVLAGTAACETCVNRPFVPNKIYNSGPAKYVYASEVEAEIRKAYERGREAAEKMLAEKIADLEYKVMSREKIIKKDNEIIAERNETIADLEGQRESLYASIDLLQDRVKDLEKKILRLEVVNPAEFNRGLAHAVELAEQMQNNTTTGTIEWMQGRDDALEEIKNRLAEASENTENSSAREDDYQRIITEVLKLNPLPACKYGDQLEPPWEVIKRARLHLEKLEAVRELAEDIGECECYDEYGKRLMSSPCKYCRLQQALRGAK